MPRPCSFARAPVLLALIWLIVFAPPALPRASEAKAFDHFPRDVQTQLRLLDRLSWGANATSQAQLKQEGLGNWLKQQLHPSSQSLPLAAQAQIDAMTISQTPFDQLVISVIEQRQFIAKLDDGEQKKIARQEYQQRFNQITNETQKRFLLRTLYSENQLQEQMTWFWINHFSVNIRRGIVRAMVGDYENSAIRPHALGKFRDLLGAVVHHPAMLLYLNNNSNFSNHINENFARELMELHTLGVGSGYSQKDVQELARVLTGLGVNIRPLDSPAPKPKPASQSEYVRRGLFEFDPVRHDYGPKTLLGQPIESRGLAETDEALDRLASSPATARFISRKLAIHFVTDDPPRELVDRMASTFSLSNGDIAATLQTMFESPEFSTSLGQKFRDPIHYVIACVRLAYDNRVVSNVAPIVSWLNRMGQPLYGRETPDGYPLNASAWSSAGQMNTRFEIARDIGTNGIALFRTNDKNSPAPLPSPIFANSSIGRMLQSNLNSNTRAALAAARTPEEWNTLLFASPELMYR
ncbi:DUF1800 domain-containing protein [Variovorax sp. UC122_21]|uniref:DUF1800 domain-containing protein n=1 Tax=Variovorax sp. UC122_21 TaxID=3374554 RepID=UPI0037583462